VKSRGLSVCVCVWVVNMRSKKFDKLVLCDLDILSFSCYGVFYRRTSSYIPCTLENSEHGNDTLCTL
jgi:hypothetical protein